MTERNSKSILNSNAIQNNSPLITVLFFLVLMIGISLGAFILDRFDSTSKCTGSQTVTVRSGQTLEGILQGNVVGLDTVNINDLADKVLDSNGLSDPELFPGQTLSHIPITCGG